MEKIEISSAGILLGHGAVANVALGPALTSLVSALSTFATALGTAVPTSAGAASTLGTALGTLAGTTEATKVKAL